MTTKTSRTGTNFADTTDGTPKSNFISGHAGHDQLYVSDSNDRIQDACVPSRRRLLLVGTAFAACGILGSRPLLAQVNPGEGRDDDDDIGGDGLLGDPAQTLPGPGGPFWSGSFQLNKEKLIKDISIVVGILTNWGAVFTFMGMSTGSNSMTFLGISASLGAIEWAGIGAALDATDPPRPNYKINAFCSSVPFSELSKTAKSVFGVGADIQTKPLLEQSYGAMINATNIIVAQEYHSGAAAKKDRKWMAIHRANYVKYWNSMRSSLMDACAEMENVPNLIDSTLSKAQLSTQQTDEYYKQNKADIQNNAQQKYVVLTRKLQEFCGDNIFIDSTPPKFRAIRSFEHSLEELSTAVRSAKSRAKQLPVLK